MIESKRITAGVSRAYPLVLHTFLASGDLLTQLSTPSSANGTPTTGLRTFNLRWVLDDHGNRDTHFDMRFRCFSLIWGRYSLSIIV